MHGYGTRFTSVAGYSFKIDPPLVSSEPNSQILLFTERTPVVLIGITLNCLLPGRGKKYSLRFWTELMSALMFGLTGKFYWLQPGQYGNVGI
jgi:hypothetical protein